MNKQGKMREGIAKIIRISMGYDEYNASINPNHRNWEQLSVEGKARWLKRADKILQYLRSQGEKVP